SAVAKNLDAINEISNTVGGLVLFAKSLSGDVTFTADEIKVMEAQEEAINDLIVELNDLAAQCNGTAPTKEQEEKARKTWADLKTRLKAFMDGEVIQKLQAPLGANRIDENFDSPASS